ncbi:hypothetical protein RN001_003288 [Aquatica leii]|uniref:MYND-type domain-containing protein n=1 Tax=Aquatica leii TaxID=1421715 RepID=A0AAN7Q9E3_9COLE|nr:hypothetical protein RN001_003288 [Aquatica leii]
MSEGVDIGFVEECESWKLESRLFPSKIGGKPAWLELEHLPSLQDLQCGMCNQQMIFLCQVYAPYEDDENNFHRTLFIFICRNSICSQRNTSSNLKVFRSCLPRRNKFYSNEPPLEQPDLNFSLSKWVKLCNLCGCIAEKHCGKCKAGYCCREHQVTDWKETHKEICGANEKFQKQSKILFKEYELIIDEELLENTEVDESKALQEYEKLEHEGKVGTLCDASETDLEAHAFVDQDATFSKFRKRISENSEQVLRYKRGGTPLWIAENPKPLNVPCCEYCKGPRQFEFQVMPQMLSVLCENELDWGILVVYSCKNSCTDYKGYKLEFIFRQDVSDIKLS